MSPTLAPGSGTPDPDEVPGSRAHLYRRFFEHAPLEVHVWQVVRDPQGAIVNWRLVDANSAALRAWGARLEDVVDKTADEIFPGADAVATFLPVVQDIMASGQPKHWETDFAGTGQVLRMVSIPVDDHFISTGVDVSAERARQEALERALQRVTQATRAGGVGLWDWDLRTNEVHYSDEWKLQIGHAPDEIAGTYEEWRSRVHPDDLAATLARVQATVNDPRVPYDVVFRLRHKDGSYRWILAQSSIVCDDDGRPLRMLGSHVDITEQRRMQEQLRAAQKLESVGTLAAGIAHDFNNLLTAFTGNLSLLRDTPPGTPPAPVLLQALEEAATRATSLTKQLLTFAKGGAPVRNVCAIRELIVDSATFMARGSKARCIFDIAEDLAAVNADLGQLSQVIGNLVINAVQALPLGGTIRVSACNATVGHGDATGLPAGRYVRISVADEGCGIAPDVLGRIFDPFFTTKSEGSGLGLSTSYAIVAQHGGRITVESTPGQGTTFTVHLPASNAKPDLLPTPRAIRGSGRVLVMDDDEPIRVVVQSMLRRLGYQADACRDGDDALACCSAAMASGSPYDVVILDLTIPGSEDGAAVLRRLRERDPDVTAIVASGYADDGILADHTLHGFRGRLHKPFDMTSLSIELDRVLHAR